MSGTTYYQRNREVILNRAKKYYRNNRDELREKARDKYRELSKEEKNIKREYGRNRYHNMSEKDKQRLKEYQKKKKIMGGLDKQHNYFICIFFNIQNEKGIGLQ